MKKLSDINITTARFAPRELVAKKLVRFGAAGLLIQLEGGPIVGAKLNEYHQRIGPDTAELLTALRKLGVIDRKDIVAAKVRAKKLREQEERDQDARVLKAAAARLGLPLSVRQLKAIERNVT